MSDMFYIIELRVDFDRVKLHQAALSFVNAAIANDNPISFCVGGYDDDVRELWEVPEVMRYLREWCKIVKRMGGHGLDRLDEVNRTLLLVASEKGRLIKTKHGMIY